MGPVGHAEAVVARRVAELEQGVCRLQQFTLATAAGLAQLRVNILGEETILVGVRAVVIVEIDAEIGEVAQVLGVHALDQFLRRDALGLRGLLPPRICSAAEQEQRILEKARAMLEPECLEFLGIS